MLNFLKIDNFAIIAELELTFYPNMTVLTGETGAGKSILLDALNLVLGGKSDSSFIGHNKAMAQVIAQFSINQEALNYLNNNHLPALEKCTLQRIIYRNGKSKAFINNQAVASSKLKELSEFLINIHGQHQHHALLRPQFQLQLLDAFGNNQDYLKQLQKLYNEYLNTQNTIEQYKATLLVGDKLELLNYQLEELIDANLNPLEWQTLDKEQKELTAAESNLEITASAIEQLEAINLAAIATSIKALPIDAKELLNQASIYLQEACASLSDYNEKLIIDPEKLTQVNNRLEQLHKLSRKHKVTIEQLYEHYLKLQAQYNVSLEAQSKIKILEDNLIKCQQKWQQVANLLTSKRQQDALTLEELMQRQLSNLALGNAQFKIKLVNNNQAISSLGQEAIEFFISLNPGQPLKPLRKIASGGELSRISLAISVLTALKLSVPTIIFDEIDSGIGGGVGETIGKLIRQLSNYTQTICITHLAQVAAQAQHHFKVEKIHLESTTHTHITQLNNKEKIAEIARMLGGINITSTTLKHAKELLLEQ